MDVDKCENTFQLRSSKESQCYFKSDNDDNTKPVIMDSNKQIQKDCIGELHGVSCSKVFSLTGMIDRMATFSSGCMDCMMNLWLL